MNKFFFSIILSAIMMSCGAQKAETSGHTKKQHTKKVNDLSRLETAVFASGCFWCAEAIFESVTGVEEAISGYAGGSSKDAHYDIVSSGRTDHAESVKVYYDPSKISYNQLLEVFFAGHDPTTLNRQGPDKGRQYRSAIFYKNEKEKLQAEEFIKNLEDNGSYDAPITTTLEALEKFFPAEDYHQDYERMHPNNPYIQSVSIPRLNKFKARKPQFLKKNRP